MSKIICESQELTDTADAIREMTNTTEQMTISSMPSKIRSIQGGNISQEYIQQIQQNTTDILAITNELANNGSVEITSGEPQNDNTVLIIDPDGEEVQMYTSGEVDAIVNSAKASIPTKLSDLSDDSTHRLVTDEEKTQWNANSNISLAGYATETYVKNYAQPKGKSETWTFTLEDGSTVTKKVVLA